MVAVRRVIVVLVGQGRRAGWVITFGASALWTLAWRGCRGGPVP
jgi:hypothetical protein